MALIPNTSLSKAGEQVRLPYQVISPKGVSTTRELCYGRKNRKTPFMLKELEIAHNMVIDELDPDRLFLYSKTVLKNRVMAQYRAILNSITGEKMGKEHHPLNDSNKEKVEETHSNPNDYSIQPKTMTIIDVFRPGGTTALLLAGGYSGKSTMLVHALNNIVKDNHYDVIMVFTESINSDPLKDIESDKVILANKFFPSIVTLAYQINKATNNRYRFLFVLDDVYDLRYNKVFQKMIVAYRNSGISTIVVTQHSTIIPPAVRSNMHKICFLGSKDEMQKESVISDWLRGYIMARGIKNKDMMKTWFSNNTRLGKEGVDNGKYIELDNVKAEMSVQDRPKPKSFA